jgi:hypothetical protein
MNVHSNEDDVWISVIPAQAGIHAEPLGQRSMDSRERGNDALTEYAILPEPTRFSRFRVLSRP